jgi:hypothetical protein
MGAPTAKLTPQFINVDAVDQRAVHSLDAEDQRAVPLPLVELIGAPHEAEGDLKTRWAQLAASTSCRPRPAGRLFGLPEGTKSTLYAVRTTYKTDPTTKGAHARLQSS